MTSENKPDKHDIESLIKSVESEYQDDRDYYARLREAEMPYLKKAAELMKNAGIDVDLDQYDKHTYQEALPENDDLQDEELDFSAETVLSVLADFIKSFDVTTETERIELAVKLLALDDGYNSIPELRSKLRSILQILFKDSLPQDLLDDTLIDSEIRASQIEIESNARFARARLMASIWLRNKISEKFGEHDDNGRLASLLASTIHYNYKAENTPDLSHENHLRVTRNIAEIMLDPLYIEYSGMKGKLDELIDKAEELYRDIVEK